MRTHVYEFVEMHEKTQKSLVSVLSAYKRPIDPRRGGREQREKGAAVHTD